jgi:dolichyl-phosphate-mannose--protein O-mannosyl transferase
VSVRLDTHVNRVCVCLYAVAQTLFLIGISAPRGYNFDESHYVPAAKQVLQLESDPNREHPPLGKLLIAAGIGLFGDRPLGWRFMSTVFGALTLVGMYLWALALFKDRALALWAALLTLVNHLLYVQARIGMLDTFMFAFITWACAAFTAAWDTDLEPGRKRRYLACAGWMLGLATATKWFGVIVWAACLGIVLLVHVFQTSSRNPFAGITASGMIRYLVIYPLLAYVLCFLPRILLEHHGPWYLVLNDFLHMQTYMYERQLLVPGRHPYLSHWYQWPFLNRPIWYAFEPDGSRVHGVLLLGNPLVMWGGMLALVVCATDWVRDRSRAAFLVLFFYLTFLVSWIAIPRSLALYYYYYPAGMTLSLALAYVFQRRAFVRYTRARWVVLAVATAIFVYFLPVLSGMPIETNAFHRWMWFASWI